MAEDKATAKPVVAVEGRPLFAPVAADTVVAVRQLVVRSSIRASPPPSDIVDKMFDRRELTTIVTTTGPTTGDIQRHLQPDKRDEFGLYKRFSDHR